MPLLRMHRIRNHELHLVLRRSRNCRKATSSVARLKTCILPYTRKDRKFKDRKFKDRKFQSQVSASYRNFLEFERGDVTSIGVGALAKGTEQDKEVRSGEFTGKDTVVPLRCPRNGTGEMKRVGEANAEEERGSGFWSCSNDSRFFEGLSVR